MKPLPKNPKRPIMMYVKYNYHDLEDRVRILMSDGKCFWWPNYDNIENSFLYSCFAFDFSCWFFESAKETLVAMKKWDKDCGFEVIEWGYI